MIEHVSYAEGSFMLGECYRILKKNGRIRLSTPNLSFLIDLYTPRKTELQKQYIDWATRTFVTSALYGDDAFVINNFVRHWGHQFIYDEKTLCRAMEKAGFSEIDKLNLNESADPTLRNLENEGRIPRGFLRLETLTLEATKR